MSYHLRAFCRGSTLPTLAALQAWMRKQGSDAVIGDRIGKDGLCPGPAADLSASDWHAFALSFRADQTPILVECCTDDRTPDCPCRREADEFAERIGPAGRSKRKQRVLDHLAATRLIVSCRIPDTDDDPLDAAQILLDYFLERRQALIQADLEGFYDAERLLVALEP